MPKLCIVGHISNRRIPAVYFPRIKTCASGFLLSGKFCIIGRELIISTRHSSFQSYRGPRRYRKVNDGKNSKMGILCVIIRVLRSGEK